MSADGTGVTRLTNYQDEDRDPAWSPDGSRIAFSSYRNAYGIHLINPDGTGGTRLSSAWDVDPAWSPDGRRIVFGAQRDGSVSSIYLMNVDGSGVTRLTSGGYAASPAWSPDGTKIAFGFDYRTHTNNEEIYLMSPDGTNVTRLTNHDASDNSASWSPDGTKIAFISSRARDKAGDWYWALHVMNADGTNVTQLTNDDHPNTSHPAWSPDGTKIAFTSIRDDNSEIYVIQYNNKP